jgi:MoaA/NifB/PqqE/SkfB family radical SAM enzyme
MFFDTPKNRGHSHGRAVRQGLAQLGAMERFEAVLRFVHNRARRNVLTATLEMTRRCVAKCDFCDHWREPKQPELAAAEYADIVRRLDPYIVLFCGGEPLIRKDILEIVRAVVAVPGWRYHVLITNGWFLTRELGLQLDEAGLHQLNVSLNWPDDRQSAERKLRGLFDRIAAAVPAITAEGVEVNLNSVIMRDNLEEVVPIAKLALQWGAKVTYTLYSEYCNGNAAHQFKPTEVVRFAEVVEELIELKRAHHHITNSAFYLRECVAFLSGKTIGGCPAGQKMVHISPQGMVKPCADLPAVAHYKDFDPRGFEGVSCSVCWMACRGEVQVPVDLQRVREVIGF